MLGYQGDLFQVLWTIAQFGPALVAFVVCWCSGAAVRSWARGIIRWRVSPWWYVFAVWVPILVYGVQDAVFGLLGNPVNLSLGPGSVLPFIITMVLLTLYAGLGEEPGWRGFALPRLQSRHTPVAATAMLGLIWALWHFLQVFVDPRFPHRFTSLAPLVLLALLTLVGIALMAFFYSWVYNATQSVLLCMLLHGSFNTTSLMLAPAPLEVLQRGVYVTLLVVQDITPLVAIVVLVVATGGRLSYNAAPRSRP